MPVRTRAAVTGTAIDCSCCPACAERHAEVIRRLDALEQARRPGRDPERLERIMRTWAASFGSRPILVSELLRDPNVRIVAGSLTPSTLGCWLREVKDRPVAGYVVTITKSEDGKRLWQILAVTSAMSR